MAHEFGSCVPSVYQVAGRLIREGKKPQLHTGYVTLKKSRRKIKHSWVVCGGKIIDNTADQFDKYGGIKSYHSEHYFVRK
jgi:hypothetical protein